MSYKEATFYAVVCDWPDCGAMDDDGEFTYWNDPGMALDNAKDGDWYVEDAKPPRIFCPEHHAAVLWLSDEEPPADDPDDAQVITLPSGERVRLEQ